MKTQSIEIAKSTYLATFVCASLLLTLQGCSTKNPRRSYEAPPIKVIPQPTATLSDDRWLNHDQMKKAFSGNTLNLSYYAISVKKTLFISDGGDTFRIQSDIDPRTLNSYERIVRGRWAMEGNRFCITSDSGGGGFDCYLGMYAGSDRIDLWLVRQTDAYRQYNVGVFSGDVLKFSSRTSRALNPSRSQEAAVNFGIMLGLGAILLGGGSDESSGQSSQNNISEYIRKNSNCSHANHLLRNATTDADRRNATQVIRMDCP